MTTDKKNVKEATSSKKCQVIIELIRIDKDGNRSEPTIVNGNSWTKQAAQNVQMFFRDTDITAVKDTGAVSRVIDHNNIPRFDIKNTGGSVGVGIVIGMGATAADRDNFEVEDVIGEGSGLDQMNYGATAVAVPIGVTNGYRLIAQRTMTNNSALSIDVRELCVICRTDDTINVERNFLILRDVLGADFPVAAGESVLVKYNFDFKIS